MSQDRIAVLIDGANLYTTARTLNVDIDYRLLREEIMKWGRLLRCIYYTATVEDNDYISLRPLLDWLAFNGYSVVTKAAKEFFDQNGRRKVKGNMDVEIVVDALELAPHVQQIILFSGDGDLRAMVEAVQRRGVRVTVVSSMASQPPVVADELRRQADEFIEISQMHITRATNRHIAAASAR